MFTIDDDDMTEAFPRPSSMKTPSTAFACVAIKERKINMNKFFIVASANMEGISIIKT
jgi:hypothetical protein